MLRSVKHIAKWLSSGKALVENREFCEAVLTIAFAIVLGGIIAIIFIPAVKEALWPVFEAVNGFIGEWGVVDMVLNMGK